MITKYKKAKNYDLISQDGGRLTDWGLNTWLNPTTTTATTATSKYEVENTISIFPNPTKGLIKVSIDRVEGASYTVTSVDGRIVKGNQNISHKDFVIDLNGKSKGLYLLRIKYDRTNNVYKIIKELFIEKI